MRAVPGKDLPASQSTSASTETVLFVHDAGLLARYYDEGGHDVLIRLQNAARRPAEVPHGLWLLCPVEAAAAPATSGIYRTGLHPAVTSRF